MKFCQAKDCIKNAIYGEIGGNRSDAAWCNDHKYLDHVNLISKRCNHTGCTKQPYYGIEGGKAIACKSHALPGYTDVKTKRCNIQGCIWRATHGLSGSVAIICIDHASDVQINLKIKTCANSKCTKRALYGQEGCVPKWCLDHSDTEHINLNTLRCRYPGCKKAPNFGASDGRPLYCKTHSDSSHINVVRKRCQTNQCNGFAMYGTIAPQRCREHCQLGDRQMTSQYCKSPGCKKRALFALPNLPAEWCRSHAPERSTNIASKLCSHPGCSTTHPTYGYLFGPKIHCAQHRTHGMHKNNHPICKCGDKQPCWTDQEDSYPVRCEECKIDKDKNVVELNCETCGLMSLIREDFANCDDCETFITKKPHKAREMLVKDILDEAKVEYKSHDKIPEQACHRYRPDFLLDHGSHVVILEVDEDQHKGYACECEHARMINLFQDQGGTPVVFIRFNPDNYRDKSGKLHQWTAGRGQKLLDVLQRTRTHLPEHVLSAVHLYYDGFDANVIEFVKIDYGM